MLRSDTNYPYPLLRTEAVDYVNSTFNREITVEPVKNKNKSPYYKVTVKYKVDNKNIQEMIRLGELAYALQVRCKATWLNAFYKTETEEQIICLKTEDVKDAVEICPCIITIKDLNGFINPDFADEFKGGKYSIKSGQVIGIGDAKKFEAVYEDDIIKSGSIVTVSENHKGTYMETNLESDLIDIYLPKDQFKEYRGIGMRSRDNDDLLIGVCIMPALVQCIMEMGREERDPDAENIYREYAWYKTIKFLLKENADYNEQKYTRFFDTPVSTAQMLLNGNSSRALNKIAELS